jgi:RNA polymerase sigma-70 factor, ECF subfamily
MRTDDRVDDHLLITRIVRRDATALEQLYARYRPRLWRYLLQQLDGDSGAVDDLLQEIFLAVWRASGDFRGDAQVNTWIFRIAHHQLAHRQRSAARRPEGRLAVIAPTDDDHDIRSDDTRGEFAQASHEEAVVNRVILIAAFRRLAPKHREALELVYQQGFTFEEVAQILDIPLGTVKSRISNARRALQHELACAAAVEELSS